MLPLKLERLGFKRRKLQLIRDISVTVDSPGTTVLMGPNGAGKSLLLRLMHGLLEPDTGRVLWDGEQPGNEVRRRQAMVFQRPVLLRRSVLANLAFVLQQRNLPVNKDYSNALLQRVGLQGMQDRPARLLSGGEQQRLAVARALATRPQVLLMDEPTSSLDPSSTAMIETIIRETAAARVKIFFVTHDIDQGRRLADDVMFMHRGQLLEHAPADEFFDGPGTSQARQYLDGQILI
jgi:tungstate transport system ATP-binding protein